jgi:hypothetical protein
MLVRRGNRPPADAGRRRRLPVPGLPAEDGDESAIGGEDTLLRRSCEQQQIPVRVFDDEISDAVQPLHRVARRFARHAIERVERFSDPPLNPQQPLAEPLMP